MNAYSFPSIIQKIQKGYNNPKLAKRHIQGQLVYPFLQQVQQTDSGIQIMEEDWDNLIILDACRFDTFQRLWIQQDRYDAPVECAISQGETTARFLRENFYDSAYLDTIFVSANAVVGDHADHIDVYKLLGLWGDNTDFADFDRRYRDVVPPEDVVEKTLEMQQEHPDKRLISHFLQPHPPFIVKNGELIEPGSDYRDFTAARKREMSREVIKEVYEENTEYVIEYVLDLVNELEGKTVITADHGEILGEGVPPLFELLHPRWSFRNRNRFDYAHFDYVRVPELVMVPWCVIEDGSRKDIKTATQSAGVDIDEDSIEDRLEALGYR